MLLAVAKGSIEIIKLMLLNKDLDLNIRDSYSGANAFWLACYYGRGSIMKELANAGIDIYNTNNEKVDVLHLSIYLDRPNIVSMLLKSYFSLENITNKGYSVIHLCSILNRNEILQLIMNHLKKNQYKSDFIKKLLNNINEKCSISALSFAII